MANQQDYTAIFTTLFNIIPWLLVILMLPMIISSITGLLKEVR